MLTTGTDDPVQMAFRCRVICRREHLLLMNIIIIIIIIIICTGG